MLFGFIDFNQFKKSILEAKKFRNEAYDQGVGELEKIADISENEAMFNTLIQEDPNDKSTGWYKTLEYKEKDGFTAILHQKPVKGKTLNVVRSQNIMRDIKFETFYKLYKNFDKYQHRFDTHKSQVSFKMVEHVTVVDGILRF